MNQIIENNIKIARFLGGSIELAFEIGLTSEYSWNGEIVRKYRALSNMPDAKVILCQHLEFHSSWEWIWSAIEWIEHLGYGFTMDPWGIEIIDYTTGNEEVRVTFENDDDYPKKEQYYRSIFDFVEWFEKQTKS